MERLSLRLLNPVLPGATFPHVVADEKDGSSDRPATGAVLLRCSDLYLVSQHAATETESDTPEGGFMTAARAYRFCHFKLSSSHFTSSHARALTRGFCKRVDILRNPPLRCEPRRCVSCFSQRLAAPHVFERIVGLRFGL